MPRPRTFALVLALVAMLSACSDGGSDNDGGGASGKPLVLGFINMEGSPAGSFPEASAGARAAVAHVNDDLGGIGHRPLKLVSCTTDGTPESSQACAQEVLAAKPVAVVGGVDLGSNSSVHVVVDAGVPYVTGSPTLGAELTTDGAFALTGGTAADLLGIGDYLIERRHVRRISVLHEDLPGLLNTAISAAGDIFRAKNVAVKLVAEKADAADFAPAVNAAAAGSPDAVIVVFPAQACARIVQAAHALRTESQLYLPGACATPGVVAAARTVLGRTYFGSGYLPVGATGGGADADAFRARVPKGQRSPVSEAAFSTILDLAVLMAEGAVDPAGLRARLNVTSDQPNVLSHPYTCDGRQLPLLRSVCSSHIRLLQHRDGAFVDVLGAWVTGAKLNELVR